jgi:hypothetical protein
VGRHKCGVLPEFLNDHINSTFVAASQTAILPSNSSWCINIMDHLKKVYLSWSIFGIFQVSVGEHATLQVGRLWQSQVRVLNRRKWTFSLHALHRSIWQLKDAVIEPVLWTVRTDASQVEHHSLNIADVNISSAPENGSWCCHDLLRAVEVEPSHQNLRRG